MKLQIWCTKEKAAFIAARAAFVPELPPIADLEQDVKLLPSMVENMVVTVEVNAVDLINLTVEGAMVAGGEKRKFTKGSLVRKFWGFRKMRDTIDLVLDQGYSYEQDTMYVFHWFVLHGIRVLAFKC